MKRAVEANAQGLRGRRSCAARRCRSFAIVVARDSAIYDPEMLKESDRGDAEQRSESPR